MSIIKIICAVAVLNASCGVAAAQSVLRGWGLTGFTTEARDGTFLKLVAGWLTSGVLRADGMIFSQGSGGSNNLIAPLPPPGTTYVDVDMGRGFTVALLSDGTVTGWGNFWESPSNPFYPPPAAPLGTSYISVAAGQVAAAAIRSDGQVVVWGDPALAHWYLPIPTFSAPVRKVGGGLSFFSALLADGTIHTWGNTNGHIPPTPPLPPGVRYIDLAVGGSFLMAVRSDGVAVGWGYDPGDGRTLPPTLPAGVSYVEAFQINMGRHALLLRSDGEMEVFGDNNFGQCNMPQLPPGLQVVKAAGGNTHSIAMLSDGSVIAWGANSDFQADLLTRPAGQQWIQMARGEVHTLALSTDGNIHGFGRNSWGQLDIPPLPSGMRYTQIAATFLDSAAIRSDGMLLAWGRNAFGQNNIPAPPAGVRYTQVSSSSSQHVALRSDGQVVGFGQNGSLRSLDFPALPPGLRYTQVAAGRLATGLLRSDGQILVATNQTQMSQSHVPPLPPGLVYTAVACGETIGAGLRSDGLLALWGSSHRPNSTYFAYAPEPPLPAGVVYVEIISSGDFILARRSDGTVIATGICTHWDNIPMPLFPNTSYVEVCAYSQRPGGRVGPTTTYVSFANGCAGSRPATRLIPRDTPKIGRTMQVTMLDLPTHSAFMLFGFGRPPAPVSLHNFGMPGCFQHVDADAVTFWTGADHQARFEFPIPGWHGLIGQRFYNQAIVLDPNAGNALGAVVSNAAEGVIGDI